MSINIKVRGYHLDIYRHVNNGRYLEFLEEGRWDYFDRHQFVHLFESIQLGFVVANININYRRPAYVNEVIQVQTRLQRIGNKSGEMQQQVWLLSDAGQTDTLIADATITFCLMDEKTQRAVEIKGELRTILETMLKEGL